MGKKKKVIAYLAVLGLTVAAIAAPQDGRKLVWSDEFGGSSLDATKWKFHATMNSDDCVYTNDSRTARVEDGCLHLLVVPSGDPAKPQMLPRGVSTRDKMAFRYGYLEMRARVPFRHGAWPSFWMTVQPGLRKAAWGSEVDIFEVFSSSNTVVANLHKWAGQKGHFMLPGGEGSLKRAYFFKDCSKLNDEFHVYGFEWTPKEMSFYVDGEKYATFPIDEAGDYCPKEKLGMAGHHDFHNININNEIFTPGHEWCPPEKRITANDRLPIEYWIDWVRLYQKDGELIRLPELEHRLASGVMCCSSAEVAAYRVAESRALARERDAGAEDEPDADRLVQRERNRDDVRGVHPAARP